MAINAGLIVPVYTCTGWGGSPVLEDEVLPLYGGYAYTPWNVNDTTPFQQPTNEYIFHDFYNNQAQVKGFDPPYLKEKYPFACCEMGGEMQNYYQARFIVDPESVAAMTIMKIAGGCNFIGYYMYHGGTNPVGKYSFLNECAAPKITYDFQALIGEFGQVRESSHRLRPILYFLHHFGADLAPMATVLPADAGEIQPADTNKLRYAARINDKTGYLFPMRQV